MKTNRLFWKPAVIAAGAVMAIGVSAQTAPLSQKAPKGSWNATVTEQAGGHRMGNPEAPARLIEFMSYTCSHCATFARTGDSAIKLLYVPSGKVSYEIRHMVRDPVDLTATLVAQCGGTAKFFGNHEALISRQGEWMAKAQSMTQAQMARWKFGSFGARAQAIASDLGFYEIMERRGLSRPQLDQCLTNEAKARQIAQQSSEDTQTYGLAGTPSFVLGGKTLHGVHSWDALQPLLDKF